MAIGRPTKYNNSLLEKAYKYLEIYEDLGDVIPSHTGLARYLDITTQTLYQWVKHKNKKEFSYTVERLKNLQELMLLRGGFNGTLNASMVILLLGNHGYHMNGRSKPDDYDCW